MEATGVYGWTDPNEADGAPRRPGPPADEQPSWLTDRPEPRSAYLFGDAPDQPDDDWAQAPTGVWHAAPADRPYGEPTAALPPVDAPTGPVVTPFERTADRHPRDFSGPDRRPHDLPGPVVAPFERAATRTPRTAPAGSPAGAPSAEGQGRHRQRGRLPRPLLIGGAAAAATLVVSLGVGALVLPDDGETDRASFDDSIAAAPVAPDVTGAPADALAATGSPSPSAAPTTASPKPSPTKTVRPTPAPTRTTAASRQGTSRTGGTSTGSGGNSVSPGVGSQAQQVVDLVNAERAKAGCGKLGIDDKLMTAAQRHSQDQADHQNMSHTGSDGSDAGDRLDRVGYAWRTYGENVAWNQQTPAAVMDAWMNSPGHRANILNCAFTEIGVGVASSNGPYWTQVFAAPR
ncbi:CAP domain-containing protein [Micromonospora coxensis]|uniref:CAP domain-containing protein n=1 Tax=Micromonospora coxensis TaxID=356852 RepID=UPI003F543AA6